ncbi:MAG: molecular chaperone HtpG [Polyangiales bacterium]|jgi:molecular chaperone HtpG
MSEHRFRIHLGGIIDLLSKHLYSSPNVFVRELLQNSTDAIRARGHLESAPEGFVRISISGGQEPQLTVEDNGVGLTEDEVHEFLSTIGASSKREEIDERRKDFIGQFGIGLLSCFVVSEEIAVITRSAKGGSAITWRGKADGTYRIEVHSAQASEDIPIGTTVHLVPKPDMMEWFDAAKVEELATHFGSLLPFSIEVSSPSGQRLINETPPWKKTFASVAEAHEASLGFGERLLGHANFFDVIPLHCDAGKIDGLAFVLPYSPPPNAPAQHRVYLKDMLLSEKAENLLPPWAFFVTCVLNTAELRPTASRESFYEDDALLKARDALGESLRRYLVDLRSRDPKRLAALIALHYRAIKAIAVHDTELFALFIDLLPFETSMGRMSFGEVRKRYDRIHYSSSVDVFRQIAQVASAQKILVINAGYSYDPELLARAAEFFSDIDIEEVEASDVAQALGDVADSSAFDDLLRVAGQVLDGFDCDAQLKRFAPNELPVLYVTDASATFGRSIEVSQRAQAKDSLWSGMLDNLSSESKVRPALIFNAGNPLVARMAHVEDEKLLTLTVQMLYVQALLLGHHALRSEEMSLLNVGLLDLIEWGLDQTNTGPVLQ